MHCSWHTRGGTDSFTMYIPREFLRTNVRHRGCDPIIIVVVLKLENCDILNGSLAQALQFWSLVITIPVWCRDPQGSPMKFASDVYYVKSMGTKVITQQFYPCTWRFCTSSVLCLSRYIRCCNMMYNMTWCNNWSAYRRGTGSTFSNANCCCLQLHFVHSYPQKFQVSLSKLN